MNPGDEVVLVESLSNGHVIRDPFSFVAEGTRGSVIEVGPSGLGWELVKVDFGTGVVWATNSTRLRLVTVLDKLSEL